MTALRRWLADVLRATASAIDPPRVVDIKLTRRRRSATPTTARSEPIEFDYEKMGREVTNAVLRHSLKRAARGPSSLTGGALKDADR